MTDRLAPHETAEVWTGLKAMIENAQIQPTVYDQEYRGLESLKRAMKDIQDRKVC